MKRRCLAALLAALCLLSLTACGGKTTQSGKSDGVGMGQGTASKTDTKTEPELDLNARHQPAEGLGWGAVVSFGSYEQDNDLSNGKEPIEWLVLDVQEDRDRVLLLSRQILDTRLFDDSEEVVFWDESSLRTWLNDSFLNEAFSEREREKVQLSDLETPPDATYDTEWVPATEDRVFLLSIQEVEQYFRLAWGSTAHFYDNDTKAQPTAYALSKGLKTKNQRAEWYLRSSGTYGITSLSIVHENGGISAVADLSPVKGKLRGVRPAVWVDLDTDMTLLRKQSSDLDISLDELLPTAWAGRYVVKEEQNASLGCSVVHVYCKLAYESLGADLRDQSRLFSVYYLEGDDIVLPESASLGTYDGVPVEMVTRPDVPVFSSDAVAAEYADMASDLTFVMDALEDRVAELDHFQRVEAFGYDWSLYFPPNDADFATGIYQLDCGGWSEQSKRELLGENDYTSYLSVAPDGTAYLALGNQTPLKCRVSVAKEPNQLPKGEPYCTIWFEDSGAVKPAYYTQMVLSIHNMERAELADGAPKDLDGSVWTYTWVSGEYWTEEFWLGGIG